MKKLPVKEPLAVTCCAKETDHWVLFRTMELYHVKKSGITFKKISCYIWYSAGRSLIPKKAKIFWSYV